MPLYRSARLFTLGLALAGSCTALGSQENKEAQRQFKQLRANKAQVEAQRIARRPTAPRAQRKIGKA